MKKIFIYIFISLLMTGCIEVAPQNVNQDVQISRNGDISIIYKGTFRDLYDAFLVIRKSKNSAESLPSINEFQQNTIKRLKESNFNKEAYNIAPNQYYAKWEENTKIAHPTTLPLYDEPYLLRYGSPEIPKLITLRKFSELSDSAFYFTYDEMSDYKDSGSQKDSLDAFDLLIKKYASKYKAKVTIEIDNDLVLKSNATKITKISDDKSLHEWSNIKFEDKQSKIDFAFTFEPKDKDRYKLLMSNN